ncbi:MAG: UDP-2,3-diacylglucosamine diphosphatase LpxI [Bryobacteraceae bacterium]
MNRYAVLCGNGRFPVLALEEARKLGHDVVAVGVKGEAGPEIESLAARTYWITIAELGKLIDILQKESITELIFCGQVKHASLFSSLRPDWRMAKMLFGLKERNTDALIGGVIDVLAGEGIRVLDSTTLLKPLLAAEGKLTRRAPTPDEEKEIGYGRRIAAALSGFDVGQSVVICERACVALEAMEGTDAMLRRAAGLANGRRLTLVKGSRRRGHLLFDVPVAGPGTIATMRETGASVLAVDAGRTLLLDRAEMLAAADAAGLAVAGYPVEDLQGIQTEEVRQ